MPPKHRSFPPVLAMVLALCACAEVPTQVPTATSRPSARPLRLGTFNIENLGSRKERRTGEQLEALARFLRDEDFDVLAVQEIDKPEALRALVGRLGESYRCTLGTTGGYRGTFISVGFVWNSARVGLVQCEEMRDFPSEVDGLPVFHRKPVNAVFRVERDGATVLDFRAITVHLKASGGEQNVAKRKAEARDLQSYVDRLLKTPGEDRDVVVLGDFNHTYGAPASEVLRAGGTLRYLGERTTPTIVWFDDPIDMIAVTADLCDEVVPASFRIHNQMVDYRGGDAAKIDAGEKRWRSTFSDHFPVSVQFDTARDRDPEATFAAPRHRLPVHSGTAGEASGAGRR